MVGERAGRRERGSARGVVVTPHRNWHLAIGPLALLTAGAACTASPSSHTPTPSLDAGAAEDAGAPDAAVAEDASPGDAGSEVTATDAGREPPPACPTDMLLVDGLYCTDLSMKCLKSWYAPSNRKTICEVFEEPTSCIGEKVPKRFCIDKYEYPNQAGARPEVMNNFYHAQVLCAKQEKRVCTETEWTMACEGPSYKPYPYGYVRDATKCNGDKPYGYPNKKKLWARDPVEYERLWQGVPSGSQPLCVSDYGVYDMPGNADELAASERMKDGKYDNVTTGGPWYKGVRNQCRPKIYDHDEGFQYYYLSFRCCKETDGKPTDPRAPKQIARGLSWEKVVNLAKNSLDIRPIKK